MQALLLGADYFGTLAAARCLGERGVKVFVADEKRSARTLSSRYASERHRHPPLSAVNELVAWLRKFGKEHPGTVLYPTNDHLAWLFAAFAEELREVFFTVLPSEQAILTLLDKRRLGKACEELGIEVPQTLCPETDEELLVLARHGVAFPALIKPRTQTYLETGVKGSRVESYANLRESLKGYRAVVRFNPAFSSRQPEATKPMLQAYYTSAETGIVSISGYVDSRRIVTRSAVKVLQQPRKVGIGLCFEDRPAEPHLVDALRRLFDHVGYTGVFEAEFIVDRGRHMLIDVNPRYYSQIGFDVARKSPLPYIVTLAASGRTEEADQELERASTWNPGAQHVYSYQLMLRLMMTLQRLSGQMSVSDVSRWNAWIKRNRAHTTDAIYDARDPMPAVTDAAVWLRTIALHPRSFFQLYVANR